MTMLREIYVCELCGNIVEVLGTGDGDLVCCGQDMTLQKENTVDASKEKHVPVLKIEGTKLVVEVGSVPHPMEAKHYIEWIEIMQGSKTQRVMLQPGEAPRAEFTINAGEPISVREYCNLHGLWGANG